MSFSCEEETSKREDRGCFTPGFDSWVVPLVADSRRASQFVDPRQMRENHVAFADHQGIVQCMWDTVIASFEAAVTGLLRKV